MVTILEDKTQGDLIALSASGSIVKGDYEQVWPMVERLVQQYGKIRIYLEVHEIDMISARALWEEIKMDVKHFREFSKLAVVGDSAWKQMATFAFSFFTSHGAKYFDFNEKEQAWAWVIEPLSA